ncbi:hypothetical protein GC101_12960 [Paenibacillus sp. LMG 31459]|uniref:Uncharacterized protein n=1 Tax=Paenibacillus phytohabitans TaxID=2654978 RepID=A0ABX1YH18_9BACL|nr:hypothetical protein [Paenibacillus phytohabitans]NOU79784.1 hypothetical protein [Paenibacillus phytohabitans]
MVKLLPGPAGGLVDRLRVIDRCAAGCWILGSPDSSRALAVAAIDRQPAVWQLASRAHRLPEERLPLLRIRVQPATINQGKAVAVLLPAGQWNPRRVIDRCPGGSQVMELSGSSCGRSADGSVASWSAPGAPTFGRTSTA